MSRRILKWTIPVDDQSHPIGRGPVVHVGVQNRALDVVFVWTDEAESENIVPRSARVYGTGQSLPERDDHVGSVVAEPFVWHVLASPDAPPKARAVS